MLQIAVAVLVIVAGAAATDICDESMIKVCIKSDPPKRFPESEEEFHEFCNFAVPYFECKVDYGEKCGLGEGFLRDMRNVLRTSKEICDESTHLHAAIVNNIKCYSDFNKEVHTYQCRTNITAHQVTHYVEVLEQEGLVTPTDDEHEIQKRRECVRSLREMACFATKIENMCGTEAMETYIQFLRKLDPVPECGGSYDALPSIIRLYKVEEEERIMIANIFTKKK